MTTPRDVLQMLGDRDVITAAVKAMNAGGMAADVMSGAAFLVEGGAFVAVEFVEADTASGVEVGK